MSEDVGMFHYFLMFYTLTMNILIETKELINS